MEKIGVIGATSAVGNKLILALANQNHDVLAFSRRDHVSEKKNITWLRLPYNKEQKINTCIYVAPIWTLMDYFSIIDKFDLNRIIIISSTSKYTKEKSSSPSERALVERINRSEKSIKDWAINKNITCIILRPTMIYGGRKNRNIAEISRLIKVLKIFPLVGKGSGLRQPIHVDDLSEACLKIIEKKITGIREYDLSGGEVITYREMVMRVFRAMGLPVRLITIPEGLFRIGIMLLRMIPRFSYLNPNMVGRMNVDMAFDHSEAAKAFGFCPRPFWLSSEDVE